MKYIKRLDENFTVTETELNEAKKFYLIGNKEVSRDEVLSYKYSNPEKPVADRGWPKWLYTNNGPKGKTLEWSSIKKDMKDLEKKYGKGNVVVGGSTNAGGPYIEIYSKSQNESAVTEEYDVSGISREDLKHALNYLDMKDISYDFDGKAEILDFDMTELDKKGQAELKKLGINESVVNEAVNASGYLKAGKLGINDQFLGRRSLAWTLSVDLGLNATDEYVGPWLGFDHKSMYAIGKKGGTILDDALTDKYTYEELKKAAADFLGIK